MALQERLTEMLEPVVEAMGYELVLLEFGANSGTLRLYIDAAGGITLDDCAAVSREVAGLLDVEDPIPHGYQLEVSSPGLDRPLAKPSHFERYAGEVARIQLIAPRDGRRRFQGVLRGIKGSAVVLETAEGQVELEMSEIERARLVPQFDQESRGS